MSFDLAWRADPFAVVVLVVAVAAWLCGTLSWDSYLVVLNRLPVVIALPLLVRRVGSVSHVARL